MTEQFIKNYAEFEKAGFRPTEVSILSHLYDYGNLSVKNGWIENGVVFVKYLRSSLASKINVSVDTITRSLKVIEDKGWIKVKRQKNAASIYYLPKYNDVNSDIDTQNASTENANCNMNQTNFKHTNNKHKDTIVTKKDNNSQSSSVNESEIIIDAPKGKTMHFDDNDAMQNILNGVKTKVEGCTKPFINTMVKYAKNYTELDKLFGIIFKSKNAAKKSLSAKFKHATQALTFETNEYLMPELDSTMKQLFLKINVEKGIKSKYGYIYNSLVKFFKQRVYNYVENLNYYRNKDFNIPIIKLDK